MGKVISVYISNTTGSKCRDITEERGGRKTPFSTVIEAFLKLCGYSDKKAVELLKEYVNRESPYTKKVTTISLSPCAVHSIDKIASRLKTSRSNVVEAIINFFYEEGYVVNVRKIEAYKR